MPSPACKVREGFLEEGVTTQGKKVDLTFLKCL